MLKRPHHTMRRIPYIPVSRKHPITRTPEWHELSTNWNNMLHYYAAPGLLKQGHQINATIIFEKVSKYFDLTIHGMVGKRRYKKLVMARQIAQYLLRYRLKMPLEAIGKLFNRDHTSICHSIKFIKGQLSMKHETEISTHLINIENQLKW